MGLDWQRLMPELSPETDQVFSMRFSRRDPPSFFNASPQNQSLCQERILCLQTAPKRHAALLEPGIPLLAETYNLAFAWDRTLPPINPRLSPSPSPERKLFHLGRVWEPDFLLLQADDQGVIRLWGGCVCFPSSWALERKMGCPLTEIHGPVPGLNQALNHRIDNFLKGMRPGIAWMRVNWGMSRSVELNQHPARHLARLEADVPLSEIWFRVEHQALVRLPETNGILFGIRIANHALSEVRQNKPVAQRLFHHLKTMPEDLARYKNLDTARPTILDYLSVKT